MNSFDGWMRSHIIRFFATVFSRMWFGLHYSIVLKLFGIVIRAASYPSLLFRYMRDRARSAAGAVICRLTEGPSLILEHLV